MADFSAVSFVHVIVRSLNSIKNLYTGVYVWSADLQKNTGTDIGSQESLPCRNILA